MRIFLDTEFSERGPAYPVILISIGLVAEDGRELYLIHSGFTPEDCNPWVRENVLPNLDLNDGWDHRCALDEIARQLREFCDPDKYGKPEFWGYFSDYDWVVFCQIFGTMVNLPEGWPKYCLDMKQLAVELGNPKLPTQDSAEHNALNDARWNKQAYDFLTMWTGKMRMVGMSSGLGMIVDERLRQISQEGFSPAHDDVINGGQAATLTRAAMSYADSARRQLQGASYSYGLSQPYSSLWPWEDEWWKPSPDPIRNLVKAGALLCAEIDRLTRQQDREKEAAALAVHQKQVAIEELKRQPVSDPEKFVRCDWCGLEVPKPAQGSTAICDLCIPF